MPSTPWVDQAHFAAATRDTGYRGTSSALAELVDNALQAGASEVDVEFRRHDCGSDEELTVVAVQDNGCGMTRTQLQRSLQWGGSSRFNDRAGIGRYGMGLPNSSVSQARRVDVYSWRHGSRPYYCYLDLDELVGGKLTDVPLPGRSDLPGSFRTTSDSGTLVVWSKCDRLDYKRIKTLEDKVGLDLGRMFRHSIWKGLSLRVNGRPVSAIDPLFLKGEFGRAIQPVPPLEYPIRVTDEVTSNVRVTFALLPVRDWHAWPLEAKRARGIVGNAGVSILRAGREIASGWYFMDGKRKQNYDDWWRVEVSFEPAVDELMGVTHSKQGIRPTKQIQDVLGPDIGAIARELSTRVRGEFAVLGASTTPATRVADTKDWRLPRVSGKQSNGRAQQSHVTYGIRVEDSDAAHFFRWRMRGGRLDLILNGSHPFFRTTYDPLRESRVVQGTTAIEMLLLGFARSAAASSPAAREHSQAQLQRWSDALAAFLGD